MRPGEKGKLSGGFLDSFRFFLTEAAADQRIKGIKDRKETAFNRYCLTF